MSGKGKIMDHELVPVTQDEISALLTTTTDEYPITVPLRPSRDGRICVDSTQVDAAPALAKLAMLRVGTLRVGGPIRHTGAREVGGGNPQDHLAGLHKCEGCGGAEFMCVDPGQHDDDEGENTADGYSFPDYGVRLDLPKIQELIMASGLVTEYGAAQLAAWLDMQAYVLREPNEEI